VGPRDLLREVVEGLDPDVVGFEGEDMGDLSRRDPAQLSTSVIGPSTDGSNMAAQVSS
jgi:hypothetical protein